MIVISFVKEERNKHNVEGTALGIFNLPEIPLIGDRVHLKDTEGSGYFKVQERIWTPNKLGEGSVDVVVKLFEIPAI